MASNVRELPVAPLMAQWLAAAVDGVGQLLLVTVCGRLVLDALGIRATPQGIIDALHADVASVVPALAAIPLGVALWHLTAVVLHATPGQRLARLKLVDRQGRSAAPARLALRAVVNGLGTLALLAGPAWALLIDGRRRGPGDIVAGTVAIKANGDG